MSRLVVHDEAAIRLGGAVPSPAAAFLLTMIALPALFWLIMLKRTVTGGSTLVEEWVMQTIVVPASTWIEVHVPVLDTLIIGISQDRKSVV